jgi:hypothetical protein
LVNLAGPLAGLPVIMRLNPVGKYEVGTGGAAMPLVSISLQVAIKVRG